MNLVQLLALLLMGTAASTTTWLLRDRPPAAATAYGAAMVPISFFALRLAHRLLQRIRPAQDAEPPPG